MSWSYSAEALDLPFLKSPETIKFVESSKLMVLIFMDTEQERVVREIKNIYGSNASIEGDDESTLLANAKIACVADQHVVAISLNIGHPAASSDIKPYVDLAWTYNYVVSLVNETEALLPSYIGWHLNEADSCMLGLCAHALLEDLLKTVPEFCSDFRNMTQSETIPEMLKFYQLASSNHNGMLHCTAKYFGTVPDQSAKRFYKKVKGDLTMSFETTVIGIVFTPRTFGARLKLSSEQLKLWGGDIDELKGADTKKVGADSALDKATAKGFTSASTTLSPVTKHSVRHFPNCQASLVYSTGKLLEEPDFHPVTGPGQKAHMTLGVAPGVRAVTTGTDLLEVVALENKEKDWPTYNTSRGWLRNYGENIWVLYMNSTIVVNSLYAGVYNNY